jgi:hypothetical protein
MSGNVAIINTVVDIFLFPLSNINPENINKNIPPHENSKDGDPPTNQTPSDRKHIKLDIPVRNKPAILGRDFSSGGFIRYSNPEASRIEKDTPVINRKREGTLSIFIPGNKKKERIIGTFAPNERIKEKNTADNQKICFFLKAGIIRMKIKINIENSP